MKQARKILLRQMLLVGCFLTIAMTACAQYQIKSWTTDDGLPQNTVSSIVQTPDGYLWMTTLDGLVRYDGVRFAVFNKNNSEGIAGNRFVQVVADASGALWIVSEIGGVTRYEAGAFRFYPISQNSSAEIYGLTLNQAGVPVVSTDEGKFEWNGSEFAPVTRNAGEMSKSIVYQARNGALWYSAGQSLHRIKDNQMTDFSLPIPLDDRVWNIVEDWRGRIWLGTQYSGLIVLEDDRLKVFKLGENFIDARFTPQIIDRDGNLWLSSDRGAFIISKTDEITRLTEEQGLSSNDTTAIYQDRENNIWVGTLRHGLNRLSRQSVDFYGTKDGLGASVVHPIYQARNGDIWLGGGSLSRFRDGKFSEFGRKENFPGSITAIEEDRGGRLWLGDWGMVYTVENGVVTRWSDQMGVSFTVTDIHEDRGGTIWLATNKGIFRRRNNQWTRLNAADGLASDDAKVILEDRAGALWFGTYGGLSRFDGENLTSLTVADGLSSNLVRSLYEDADGTLWIGSYDGGLTRLKDGKFTGYTSKNGLFNDGVFQILEDARRNLWMSSNRGIYRVAKQQLDDFADGKISRITSIAYGKADGLLEIECNGGQQPAGIKDRDGKLWFPTQNGAAVIDPEKIQTNSYPPPVVIESVKVDNETISIRDSIEIAPGKNNLEINYTALSFIKPELTDFRYQLAGLDADWVAAGTRRTAYYSYLPPGEYTFRVTAANADGVWNLDGKTLKIIIVPPFYRTRWFPVLALTMVFGTIYWMYRRRVNHLEKNRRTQEMFSRRLFASQETERQRVAAELHDGIGQSLLIIKNRAFLALSDLDEPETVREQLEELSQSAAGAIEECREISYNLRPFQIKRFGLTKTLEAIFQRIFEVTDTNATVSLDSIDDVFSAEAETNIYRIVQESVNNIIKHSAASEANLKIERRGNRVEITIEDDGRGFDKNALNQNALNQIGDERGGFGLAGISERVRMLGGVCEIESPAGGGTRIKIELTISPTNERN